MIFISYNPLCIPRKCMLSTGQGYPPTFNTRRTELFEPLDLRIIFWTTRKLELNYQVEISHLIPSVATCCTGKGSGGSVASFFECYLLFAKDPLGCYPENQKHTLENQLTDEYDAILDKYMFGSQCFIRTYNLAEVRWTVLSLSFDASVGSCFCWLREKN